LCTSESKIALSCAISSFINLGRFGQIHFIPEGQVQPENYRSPVMRKN
jgi:hypothetical protein